MQRLMLASFNQTPLNSPLSLKPGTHYPCSRPVNTGSVYRLKSSLRFAIIIISPYVACSSSTNKFCRPIGEPTNVCQILRDLVPIQKCEIQQSIY